MDVHVQAFWLPKAGCARSEYEDACLPRKERRHKNVECLRFAVSDGATEASYSRLWARLLVRGYFRRSYSLPLTAQAMVPLQEQWKRRVHSRPMAWYAEEKAASGAFSSLLAMEITESKTRKARKSWRAAAIGDSNLFHISGNALRDSFPMASAENFDSRPRLLSSVAQYNPDFNALVSNRSGQCHPGDRFFLMTDALALWFLREKEQGEQPWKDLVEVCRLNPDVFTRFINHLRQAGSMKNDDVTLLCVHVVE